MKNNILRIVTFLFIMAATALPIQAAVIYESVSRQTLSKDVTYEVRRRITENGMLDIHVLKAPLTDPNITFGPAASPKTLGLRETTVALLSENGAIAGVNGDFFDMSGSLAAAMGLEIMDGRLISIDQEANAYNNSLASFFTDQNNNPFIEYLKSDIRFYTDSDATVYVKAINKITDMEQAVYIDRSAMADTQELDSRFSGLVKILVEDGIITKLSTPGEVITLPEDGFIIAMNSETADEHISKFRIGQSAEIKVSASVDLATLKMGIGGGSRILLNGQAVSDGYVISGGSRNPRTAVGISQDKRQLILMVVDGRTHSIGATQAEMAQLLLQFGAYDAMNLDGGGSSTMAIREPGSDWLKAVNTFSEGSQRKVVNALGIFNKTGTGEMISVAIETKGQVAFKGLPLVVDIYGLDEYNNRIELDKSRLLVNSNDPDGYWEIISDGSASYGDYFYPSRTGRIDFIVAYDSEAGQGFAAESWIESKELVQIIPSQTALTMGEGGQRELYFTGKSGDGFSAPLPRLQFEFSSSNLGILKDGVFTAGPLQKGYIKAVHGEVATYIEVSIGYKTEPFTSFETPVSVYGLGYPESEIVHAALRTEEFSDGEQALGLTYSFGVKEEETQAAYAVFDPPLALPDNPQAVKLYVYGDNSGHWLRAKLTGADGQEFNIDLAKEINWEGWKELEANFPRELKSPATLDRIYVAALSNQDTGLHRIYFDNIHITSLAKFGKIDIPEATAFKDYLQADLRTTPIVGRELGFLAGADNFEGEPGIKYYLYEPGYAFEANEDVAVVRLAAEKGGLTATDPYQWGQFTADISNSGAKRIIVQLNKSPLNFTYAKEYQLLHDTLKALVGADGQVFVVSNEGSKNSVTVREGIRYINMGDDELHVLRVRIASGEMKYELR